MPGSVIAVTFFFQLEIIKISSTINTHQLDEGLSLITHNFTLFRGVDIPYLMIQTMNINNHRWKVSSRYEN